MDLDEFNYPHLNPLLEKLAKQQKAFLLPYDFNLDLLKYEQYKTTTAFLILCHQYVPTLYYPPIQSLLLINFFQLYLSRNKIDK